MNKSNYLENDLPWIDLLVGKCRLLLGGPKAETSQSLLLAVSYTNQLPRPKLRMKVALSGANEYVGKYVVTS